jgi:hypothetical protein
MGLAHEAPDLVQAQTAAVQAYLLQGHFLGTTASLPDLFATARAKKLAFKCKTFQSAVDYRIADSEIEEGDGTGFRYLPYYFRFFRAGIFSSARIVLLLHPVV